MGGSCSVSNLTVVGCQLGETLPQASGKLHTVYDCTNDLMDLAILHTVGRCEALGDGRDDGLGLKGALEGRSAERRGAQRPGDAAVDMSVLGPMAPFAASVRVDVLLQHLCGSGMIWLCEWEGLLLS